MIAVILVCLYTGTICFSWGFVLPFRSKNFVLHLIYGLLVQCLLLHFWVVFLPVNIYFYTFNIAVSLLLIFLNRYSCRLLLYRLYWDVARIPARAKTLLILYAALIFMQSSVAPYIVDNESYYLQSIRWLNDYGLVPGLANLHIYFGQMSGWHILQSGFNFGFFTQHFNDINGYLALLYTLFVGIEFYRTEADLLSRYFLLGILACAPFLFQFVSVPSPDLAVYLLSPIVVYNFWNNRSLESILLLSLLIVLAKITAFPILIFAAIKWWQTKDKFSLGRALLIGGLSGLAFILKNYLATGFPLYPLSFELLTPNWVIPQEIQEFYYQYTKMHAYLMLDWEEFQQMSTWEKFTAWLTSPKLHGFFNKAFLVLLVLFPILGRVNKKWGLIYAVAILQFLILQATSPQYRFFFHFVMILGVIITIQLTKSFLQYLKLPILLLAFSPLILLVFPVNVSVLTNNDFMKTDLKTFKLDYLFWPHKNAQYHYIYKIYKEGNLKYFGPENTFIWLNGDGVPPVVNPVQIEFFKTKYGLVPQLRDSLDIHRGFYSKPMAE